MVQGEVHAKFGPDPFSSLGGEWRQKNRQTDRQTYKQIDGQTDTFFCFISIDLDLLALFKHVKSKILLELCLFGSNNVPNF